MAVSINPHDILDYGSLITVFEDAAAPRDRGQHYNIHLDAERKLVALPEKVGRLSFSAINDITQKVLRANTNIAHPHLYRCFKVLYGRYEQKASDLWQFFLGLFGLGHRPILAQAAETMRLFNNSFGSTGYCEKFLYSDDLISTEYRLYFDDVQVYYSQNIQWTAIQEHQKSQQPNTTFHDVTMKQAVPILGLLKKHFNPDHPESLIPQKLQTSFYPFPIPRPIKTYQKIIDDITIGIAHCQGLRPFMEDSYISEKQHVVINGTRYPLIINAIFDGHGTRHASCYLAKNFAIALKMLIETYHIGRSQLTTYDIQNAIKMVSQRMRHLFCCTEEGKILSGSTAIIQIILNDILWIASTGDSRAISIVGDKIWQLSEDAYPGSPRFYSSISKRHGGLITLPRPSGGPDIYRVAMMHKEEIIQDVTGLAVARSIGNYYQLENDCEVRGITPRPKIISCPLSPSEKASYILLACDGLWDVASTDQIGELIQFMAEDDLHPAIMAAILTKMAIAAESSDNVSVAIIKIPYSFDPESHFKAGFTY